MSENLEVEIKVKIEKRRELMEFLKNEAKFVGEKHQVDTYFTPAHRNFPEIRPAKEWLRLRNSSGKYSINYKNWHYEKDGKSHYCDEYESSIASLEQMEKIFQALDIKEIVTVDKVRKLYLYNEYEIAIDAIKGLGDFVEIEFKGNISGRTPAHITSEMVDFLKKTGCGKIFRNYAGYPFLLMYPGEVVWEEL